MSLPNIFPGLIVTIILTCLACWQLYGFYSQHARLPLVNKKKGFWESTSKVKKAFALHGRQILERGLRQNPGKPFRMVTDTELVTILPPEFADEIRNDDRFDFRGSNAKLMMAKYPGFEAFRNTGHDVAIWTEVVKTKLSKTNEFITNAMSEECSLALSDIIGDDRGWIQIGLKGAMLQLISRVSSRVFVGKRLCRDVRWLGITTQYTINAFLAAQDLRIWHPMLRPIAHWFIPRCRLLRAQMKDARAIIEQERRVRQVAKQLRSISDDYNDTMTWLEVVSKGRKFDPVATQLGLSVGAIHTTGDLLTQVLLDLVQHPHLYQPLREELIIVLGQHRGWNQKTFADLKLMDSVIKESQRLKPLSLVSMRRTIASEVRLSDGTVLDAGTTTYVSAHRMWDPMAHKNPLEFDGYRFLKMREEVGDRSLHAPLVTTGPGHLAWGHGQYACPGRFFAANEIKITLAHLLLKFDWRTAGSEHPTVLELGFSMNSDPFIRIMVRKREAEIEL